VASATVFREPDTNYLQINKRNANQKGNKSVTSVIIFSGCDMVWKVCGGIT
jgi:hypothetical protein